MLLHRRTAPLLQGDGMLRERWVLLSAVAMIGTITIFNILAPSAIPLIHLYSVPVLLVAWRVGLRSGLLAAGFSEIGWIGTLFFSRDPLPFPRFALTGTSLLLSLVVIAFIIGRLHGYFRARHAPVELFRRQNDAKTATVYMHTCAWCKKVKNLNNQWVTLESYLGLGGITHGICPDCKQSLVGIEDNPSSWLFGPHLA
jgi:hypothetical protein